MRFRSLHDEGCGFVFPCDADGSVDLDALSDRARDSYLYARTVIGREFHSRCRAVDSLSQTSGTAVTFPIDPHQARTG